jgi:GNAT superfamily N-acetyltransferase
LSTASAVAVGVDAVRPLRAEVLRGGGPLATAVWPGDDDPRAGHYAVLGEDGEPLAVGSVVIEGGGWRVRGMATSPAARGRGYGTVVLAALLEHARTHGGGLVWCNARPRAQSLYERAGFVAVSDVFDVPGTGPHRRLERR